ncbi:hypothetical protein SCP_0310970 [Sparassis crispa]|uniref:Protein kinase domain-containing protein n=1 Tax=Sparassis crispa TaxID=139825 RepID=A0A401GGR0_9APHY|nr:hypothetical protein SCP_0310970 [Sparassis crispa]GBE81370.1 hypothetical protein SCP_0310970 [Sparassis crispa]
MGGYCNLPQDERYLHIGYAAKDSRQEEFVLKVVSKTRKELTIIQYLNSPALLPDARNHTIPLLESLNVNADKCILIMPRFLPLSRLSAWTTPHECIRILIQVVEGVSFLHEQNIAHLDIKDTNFVVDIDTGRVYIIDYGLARRIQGPEDEVEGFRGTEDWVAPEVNDNLPYSPQTCRSVGGGRAAQAYAYYSPQSSSRSKDASIRIGATFSG